MTGSLFERLKSANAVAWADYTQHDFVLGLQRGDLPEAAFRQYLKQDYLFLIQFARAYALLIYKSPSLGDMRAAAGVLQGLIDVEMQMHVRYCADWGIDAATLETLDEAPETIAYTRYVLDQGMAGDVLDLMVALSPCVIGYGDIGAALQHSDETLKSGNPYLSWVDMYSGEEYQEVARSARAQLDALADARMTEARFPELSRIFARATTLESGFWQMGFDAAGPEDRQP